MGAPERDFAAEAAELELSGLFDRAWYLAAYPQIAAAGLDPVMHFLHYGWREGRLPNPYFDPAWYLTSYPDVVAAGMNPLLHYLRHGDLEGRRPIAYFDPDWYRTAHDLAPDRLALRHFLPRRGTGQFAPCVELYPVPFMPPWRDCPPSIADPFQVYINDAVNAEREPFPDAELLAASGLVDAAYYVLDNEDVHGVGVDPVLHYCRSGWREKRTPNIYFDTAWYLATNPRVAQLGLNPLVHYVCEGEAANRRPAPYFDPEWYRETYGLAPEQGALAHYLAHRHSQAFSPTPLFDVAWYVRRHGEELRPGRDPFLHFLMASTRADVDPSPKFRTAQYRRRHLQGASTAFLGLAHVRKDIPLICRLLTEYQ